jgi:hypothetical protein
MWTAEGTVWSIVPTDPEALKPAASWRLTQAQRVLGGCSAPSDSRQLNDAAQAGTCTAKRGLRKEQRRRQLWRRLLCVSMLTLVGPTGNTGMAAAQGALAILQ